MKIAFIGGRDIHKLGGIENYMFNLATRLAIMGHQPIVFCESDCNRSETVNGFEVRYVKGPSSKFLCKPWVGLKATLRCVFKDRDIDLIHYNAWPPSIWCWIPSLAGIPSLMEGHGLEWQRSKYSPRARKVLKLMEAFTARINRHLIMCSEAQVRYFKDRYNVDSVCIPTAVNPPSPAEDSSILDRYGIAKGRYFLFMGRLVPDKNPDYLIKAFKDCSPEGMQLVIAGSNEAMPEYVDRLHSLSQCHHGIIFTGAVYGDDKETLMNNAFCFCLPSTIEGLSIVLLEAMVHRLPIIASDIEANREVLEKDKALWVRPENVGDLADAIAKSAESPEPLAEATDFNYRKVLSHYTWDKVAEKYVSYIEAQTERR